MISPLLNNVRREKSGYKLFNTFLDPANRSVPAFLQQLYLQRQKGFKLNLDAMQTATAEANFETSPASSIQIVGTNGKGSTATHIANLLAEKGLTVGLFTSPHLLSFRERIQTSVRWPDFPELEQHYNDLKKKISVDLSFFEWAALIAKSIFRKINVDVEVWEAGLGGRLDATTAFTHDTLALTGVGLDHQHVLGDDLTSICSEKLAAAKTGQRVFIPTRLHSDPQKNTELTSWVRSRQPEVGFELFQIAAPSEDQVPLARSEALARNQALAQALSEAVADSFSANSSIKQMLQKDPSEALQPHLSFQLYGRGMELWPTEKAKPILKNITKVQIDVCHNLDSLAAALHSLKQNSCVLLYSCLKDKWSMGIEKMLSETKTPNAFFGSGPKERRVNSCSTKTLYYPQIHDVFESEWFKNQTKDEPKKLLVWGSFFGIQEFLELGLAHANDEREEKSKGAKA